jgi:hypothetical protein
MFSQKVAVIGTFIVCLSIKQKRIKHVIPKTKIETNITLNLIQQIQTHFLKL